MHGSNINVFLKDKSYFDDASLMLRSFFTGSKVVYRGEIESDPEFGSVMEKNKYFYSFDDSLYCYLDAFLPEDEETLGKSKGEIHDIFKKALYENLMEYTDRKLPWGFLTGVRPSKRAMVLLNDAFDNKKEVINTLKERYLISDKKAELAYEVAKNERHIIDEVAGKDSISLYIHIPFCPSVCAYCSFATVISNNDLMERYVDKLCYELKAFKERLTHKKIDSIYMGGGTPTALTAEQLEKALVCVEENYDLSNLLEYTVEAGRADSITKEKLEVLKKHNISRISVNPQTFNQKTLDIIGRKHTVEDVYEAFKLARELGFDNINMDVILGLPEETRDDIARTAKCLKELAPDSITMHSLSFKRAAAFTTSKSLYNGYEYISTDEYQDILGSAIEELNMEPYYMYRQQNMTGNLENIGYAKKGSECLYNIFIMEEIQSIIAFGAGSSTKCLFDNGRIERAENVKNVEQYIERVDEMIERKNKLLNQYDD